MRVVVVAVDVDVCMCVRFFLSCTGERFRVYVQNAPVCAFKTPVALRVVFFLGGTSC